MKLSGNLDKILFIHTQGKTMSLSNIFKPVSLITGLVIGLSSIAPAHAEENPAEICASAASLYKEGDIDGALDEARWCVTQLEQIKQNQTSSFFSDEINGYTADELQSQQTMGMQLIERNYSKEGQSIKVALTGGAMGAANNAFAALASFGMQSAQGEKIRIQRRTAMLTKDSGSNQLIVTLKSGGMLTFDSSDVSSDELVTFAKAFPVADLDDARK